MLELLRRDGFSSDQIRVIGTMTLVVGTNDIGKILGRARSPRSLYQTLGDVLQTHYDRVSIYKPLLLNDSEFRLQIRTSEECQETFGRKYVGSRDTCLYRQGVTMSFQANILPSFARVRESSCVYHGDEACTYSITWN